MTDKLNNPQISYEEFMNYAVEEVKAKRKLVRELAEEFNHKFSLNITQNAMQHRLNRYRMRVRKGSSDDMSNVACKDPDAGEFVTTYGDHSVEARRIIEYQDIVYGDEDKLLEYLGYNPAKWEFAYIQRSVWNQQTKDVDPESGKKVSNLYSVKFRVKPKTQLDPNDVCKAIKEAIEQGIEPREIPASEKREQSLLLDNERLMEISPVELHLGKLAHRGETGQDYDLNIAKKKFFYIFDKIMEEQSYQKCGKCLIVIGSDFFNSESDNMTTNKTPQQNDTRYKKLMVEGFKMYVSVLIELKKVFNEVDVILCSGNHARAMEFFLYHSLQQYFKDDKIISFRDDYKDTQAYLFGKCAIFYNHGDANLKRTISSIPSEFYEVWGKTIYRELHLGHLHKEVTVDDDCGMITRRIGSPTATDAWHYTNRYIGAVQKHQIFVWDANCGLKSIHYINTTEV